MVPKTDLVKLQEAASELTVEPSTPRFQEQLNVDRSCVQVASGGGETTRLDDRAVHAANT